MMFTSGFTILYLWLPRIQKHLEGVPERIYGVFHEEIP